MRKRIRRILVGGSVLTALLLIATGDYSGPPTGALAAPSQRETTNTEEKAVPLKTAVRQANDQFYDALNRMFTGELEPMEAIWSHEADVTLMGPFGGRQVGWDQVRAQFERESKMELAGRVVPQDVLVRVEETMGYSICLEVGEDMTLDGRPISVHHRTTNVFRFEDGSWKMIHHHTDVAPGLLPHHHAGEAGGE